MIIGSKVQEEVHAAFLEQFDGSADDQGLLLGLSATLHAATNLLVADVLPQFAGRGTSSDAIPMEYVAQLFIESVNVGAKMKELDPDKYRTSVAMSLANLRMMFQMEEDESE